MDIAERLVQVGEEIQHVENDLCDRRRLLTAFWGHLRPVNPAVVGDRMRATNQRIKGLERRLQMLRNEWQVLIVRAPPGKLEECCSSIYDAVRRRRKYPSTDDRISTFSK
ncbi:hypothetical protein Taro_000010 [Colocasia esculenta]|uniref:Uncharacterized protein n=1 Tax=Colocasia esculenta TaxID=4460 RepID=A0A843T9L5_COLES|nr:hypothetical protein [Colocasia esculenta]